MRKRDIGAGSRVEARRLGKVYCSSQGERNGGSNWNCQSGDGKSYKFVREQQNDFPGKLTLRKVRVK